MLPRLSKPSFPYAIVLTSALLMPTVINGQQECSLELRLISDTGSPVTNAVISAVDIDTGTKISSSPAGRVQRIGVSVPETLYKTVEVTATQPASHGDAAKGSIALLYLWPCLDHQRTTLTMSARTGDAREVRSMWESKDLVTPSDFPTAAQQYAQALQTAEARYAAAPGSAHQYDLISSYLALRAFENLMKLSDIPFTHSSDLQKIAIWHRDLLSKVKRSGLEVIFQEGAAVADDRRALANMYRRYWNEIKVLRDSSDAFERMIRFRKSLDVEGNSEQILEDIGLTRSEVMASTNAYAGEVARHAAPMNETTRGLMSEQIEATKELLGSSEVVQPSHLSADVDYLSKKLGN